MKKFVLVFLISVSILFCQPFQVAENGIVVSASKVASDIGIEIMKRGGNAVDAAVAVGFILAVVFPEAGNIGGGGFMIIRFSDGSSTAIDYREKAPSAASRNMYLGENGEPIEGLSLIGPLAVGVPGSVAGYYLAWEKYGTLPWKELIKPAIYIARDGFPTSYYIHSGLLNCKENMSKFPSTMKMFFVGDDGRVPEIGEIVCFSDLARTLRRIAKDGPEDFYKGKTAEMIVKSIQKNGGIVTLEDLEDYQAVEREPITFMYRDYEVTSMPPPSSGGICLGQILKIVEQYPLKHYGFLSIGAIQVLVEAERRVYANRAYFLGDPDLVNIPTQYLLSENTILEMIKTVDLNQATPSKEIDHIPYIEKEQTTHFSIVDKNGMAVSNTTTLNSSYGSCFVAEGTGILLNNEMDDFSIKPGFPNLYGLIGAEANAIEPNKRMLSSMTPTVVSKNDSLMWVLGTPGGATIITTIAQILINLIDFEMSLVDAVDAPRYHHQWLPDVVYIERYAFPPILRELLVKKGYKIQERGSIGDVNAIEVNWEDGYYIGVPDKRRQSAASGY
jgi:gamma-glutamyltranspeptidase/glutathione hydrolase